MQNIQSGAASVLSYAQSDEGYGGNTMLTKAIPNAIEDSDWAREETDSTVSEASLYEMPILINAKMKRKVTKEILKHYRMALQRNTDE